MDGIAHRQRFGVAGFDFEDRRTGFIEDTLITQVRAVSDCSFEGTTKAEQDGVSASLSLSEEVFLATHQLQNVYIAMMEQV